MDDNTIYIVHSQSDKTLGRERIRLFTTIEKARNYLQSFVEQHASPKDMALWTERGGLDSSYYYQDGFIYIMPATLDESEIYDKNG